MALPSQLPLQSPPCLLPCFLSPMEYLCLLWATAWLHVSSSLEKYTSSQGDMNGFHPHSCLLVLCFIGYSKELQHFHVCVLRGACSRKKNVSGTWALSNTIPQLETLKSAIHHISVLCLREFLTISRFSPLMCLPVFTPTHLLVCSKAE